MKKIVLPLMTILFASAAFTNVFAEVSNNTDKSRD